MIIADSSALISLAVCGNLPLLVRLYKEVVVPKAVFDEVNKGDKPHGKELCVYLRDKIIDIDLSELIIDLGKLGRGELEAIALFKKLHGDFLLLDDKKARKVANLNGFPVIGSLGILLSAKRKGMLSAIRPSLDILQDSGIHIGKSLLQKVLWLADEQ